jgi:group II intron reverse transcriptase/maturase
MPIVVVAMPTTQGAERVWQRFPIWSEENSTSRLKIVEACYWIVILEMIRKNRDDSSPLLEGIFFFEILFLFPLSLFSSQIVEVNNFKKTLCVKNKSKPAEAICLLDSGISIKRHFYKNRLNTPLHTTPVKVSSSFNACRKMRSNLQRDAIRGFSSSLSQTKDLVVCKPKECYLPVLYGKTNKSQIRVKSVEKGFLKRSNSCTNNFISNVADSLRQLYPEKDGVYTKITARYLANPEFLKLAYGLIKNKESNLTPGGDSSKTTLDGISANWFQKTALQLKNGTYEFKATRQISIPKKGTKATRPLTIVSPKDKIVQKAIQLIFEEIYENKDKVFLRYSHGFRPNKSPHTALKQIKEEWTAIPWVIKFDIKEAFNSINRNILISQLKLKIKDKRLFELLVNMFKVNIVSHTGILKEHLGVSQGNVLSPILANIFFHSLDLYVEKEIIDRYKKGIKPTRCSDYQRAVSLTYEEKKASKEKRKQIARRKRRDAHKAGLRYTKIDNSFVRIKYIRYADDFLIGVRGPKTLAEKVLQTVKFFLKSNLQLSINEEKSEIFNTYSNKIPFLGMLLHNVSTTHIPYRKSREIENKKRKRSRVILRAENLKHRQVKLFKDECLNLLRQAYNKHRDNRAVVIEDFTSLIENSGIFKDILSKKNRTVYREFISDLQKVTEVKESKKLNDFLKSWDEEISEGLSNSTLTKKREPIMRPITKKETIHRIVNLLKEKYKLPAYESEWWSIFRGSNKKRASDWKPIWPDNFSLSDDTVSKLLFPKNGTYHAKFNLENIRLAIEDLIYQIAKLAESAPPTLMVNNNAESVRQTWDELGVFLGLPVQINANTNEIYKRLENSSIINSKKKPISKTSLLQAEPWLIISYYNSVAYGILSYFRCVDNINTIKKIITYHIRYSLLHTLAHKHKCSIKKIIETYGKEITAVGRNNKEVSYVNSVEVTNIKKEFLIKGIRDPYGPLSKTYISLQKAAITAHQCAIKNCNETDNIEVHHIRKLYRSTDRFGRIIVKGKAKKLSGLSAIESSLKRKQIPLCPKHHKDWHNNIISKTDLKNEWV